MIDINEIKEIEEVNEIEIGELYDILKDISNYKETLDKNIIETKDFDILSLSVNDNKELEWKKINYIMQHKTEKTLYKIKLKENEIIVTEDHSCMIIRNNTLKKVKPTEIQFDDIFVYLNENGELKFTNEFIIENLGKIEENVFDIEIEDNHNFFGNNILVHNSNYVKFDKIVDLILKKKIQKEENELSDEDFKKLTDYILKFLEKEIQPVIDESVKEVQDILNAYHPGFVGAKVEKIMSKGIWVAKKKYAVAKIWDEGTYYTNPELSVTGLELIRSSTPEFAKEVFSEALKIMLLKDEKTLQNYLKEVKDKFFELCKTPEGAKQVSRISSVSSLNYVHKAEGWVKEIRDSNDRIIKKLPAPMNSRAAILYNNYIKENNLEEKYELIEEGNKIRFIYLKTPNPLGNENVIAYLDEKFLDESGLINYIDEQLQYEKIIEQPLKIISDVLNWKLKKISSLDSLF